MAELALPTVKIYVRLGPDQDNTMREVRFRIPEGLDRMELLERGFAIDGRDAVYTVALSDPGDGTSYYESSFEGHSSTLMAALAESQERS